MTRCQIHALLQVDSGSTDGSDPEMQWLLNNGYVADDGCEIYVTEKGDRFLNACCAIPL